MNATRCDGAVDLSTWGLPDGIGESVSELIEAELSDPDGGVYADIGFLDVVDEINIALPLGVDGGRDVEYKLSVTDLVDELIWRSEVDNGALDAKMADLAGKLRECAQKLSDSLAKRS